MPKNKFQEVIFTIMMVFVMVYAMICYTESRRVRPRRQRHFPGAALQTVALCAISPLL